MKRAYLAPEVVEVPVRIENGYAVVTVPEVAGYQMVVFEGLDAAEAAGAR